MISDLIPRSGDLSLTIVNPGMSILRAHPYNYLCNNLHRLSLTLKNSSYFLTENFSNVIYRRVSRRNPAKNPDSYKFVQEHLDMYRNVVFYSEIKKTRKNKG